MAQNKKRQEAAAKEETQTEIAEAQADTDAAAVGAEATEAPGDQKLAEAGPPAETLAKAGKRSRKAIEEAEAAAAKEAAKVEHAREDEKPKPAPQKPRIKVRGKKYRDAAKLVEADKHYELGEAIELAQKTSPAKFDASVELHFNLGVDPRQADQAVRGTVVLPAGTGKSLRVAVVAPADKQAEAKTAGADVVGEDTLLADIEAGKLDFDVLIATPDEMPKLSKVARVLGPKGLMPNPKSGTVTPNVAAAVKDAKAGKVEFRLDKQAIIHQIVGKVSFKTDDLTRNATTLINAVMKAKPTAAKGTYVKTMTLTTTMGPGIKLNVNKVLAEANATARK